MRHSIAAAGVHKYWATPAIAGLCSCGLLIGNTDHELAPVSRRNIPVNREFEYDVVHRIANFHADDVERASAGGNTRVDVADRIIKSERLREELAGGQNAGDSERGR